MGFLILSESFTIMSLFYHTSITTSPYTKDRKQIKKYEESVLYEKYQKNGSIPCSSNST